MNRSTYYKHFFSEESNRTTVNQDIKSKILVLYSKSNKRFGAYKIRQRLLCEYGISISVGRVYRLMKSMNLPKMSTVKPKSNYKTADDTPACENVLKQQFDTKSPNLVWVSDITFVKVAGRFCYVCVVIDLFSRKIISYKVSHKINTQLVIDTFLCAYRNRGYPDSVMFHSDRGCQYTSKEFRKLLDSLNFVQSFSAKGHPYDNAVAESFFKFLKHEELNRKTFQSIQDLKLSVFEYIEGFYNLNRPHSANAYLSPNEKENAFLVSKTTPFK